MDECGCEPVKFYLQTGGKSGFSLQAIVCQPLLSTPFRMHLAYHNSDPLIPPHKRLPVLPQIQIKFLVMTCRVICGLPLPFFLASSPVTLPARTVSWLCHPIVPCCVVSHLRVLHVPGPSAQKTLAPLYLPVWFSLILQDSIQSSPRPGSIRCLLPVWIEGPFLQFLQCPLHIFLCSH